MNTSVGLYDAWVKAYKHEEVDADGYINIDLDEVVDFVVKQAKKEGEMGPYDPEDVFFVVQGEMEYADSLEEE